MIPSPVSHLFTAPLRPSRTIQANVRTRKLVQNGSSTQRISMPRVLGRVVARRYATGYPATRQSSVVHAATLKVMIRTWT